MEKRKILLTLGLLFLVGGGGIYLTNQQEQRDLEINKLNISQDTSSMFAMYKNDGGEDEKITTMPEEGYTIDEQRSYCYTTDKNNHDDVTLYTNDNGEHIIGKLKKNSKCFLYFNKSLQLLKDGILENNPDHSNLGNSFTGIATENGLFEGTDDYGTTYYFRGAVNNNWVKFAGHYWRIIRINGNGTIRLIYSGDSSAQETGTGTAINDGTGVAFNTNSDDNKYVGFMYVGAEGSPSGSYDEAHKINSSSTKSTILQAIETWYTGTSGIAEQYRDKLDGETGFCGDRELAPSGHGSYTGAGYAKQTSAYGPAHRVWTSNGTSFDSTQEPTFNCKKQDQDLYTTIGSEGGNKSLTYPVGLITMDEVIFAGGLAGQDNTGYWLRTGEYYWTISPSYFNSSSSARVFSVYDVGKLYRSVVYSNYDVRPVINLKAGTTFNFANPDLPHGTSTNPYEVV